MKISVITISWYHIVVAFDVTQGTASNRVRLYKNGVEITDLVLEIILFLITDYPIHDNGNSLHWWY